MAAKFLIVDNDLTEAAGEGWEAAHALARAACFRGFDAILAVHARCDCATLATDFPALSIFRVGTSGRIIEQRLPSVALLRGELGPLFDTPIEAVLAGRVSLRDWLDARFALPVTEPPSNPARRLPLSSAEALLRQELDRIPAAESEFAHYQMFRADLERLLTLCNAGPRDVVYLPNAHSRDTAAISSILLRVGAERLPTFHLNFCDPPPSVGEDGIGPVKMTHARLLSAYFGAFRLTETSRLRCYGDTPERSAAYSKLSGLPFGVLPGPGRGEQLPAATGMSNGANVIAQLLAGSGPRLAAA